MTEFDVALENLRRAFEALKAAKEAYLCSYLESPVVRKERRLAVKAAEVAHNKAFEEFLAVEKTARQAEMGLQYLAQNATVL